MSNHNDNINSLTALRGILALWVVFFHITLFLSINLKFHIEEYFGLPASQFIWSGYIAVDMFFMLSGFVLCHVYSNRVKLNGKLDFSNFIIARFARIYPAYITVIVIYFCLLNGFDIEFEIICFPFDEKSRCQRYGVAELVKNIFLIQSWQWFPQTSWNVVAWSVSSEWAAYLAFPLIFPFVAKLKNPLYAAITTAILIFTTIIIIQSAQRGIFYHQSFIDMLNIVASKDMAEFFSTKRATIVEFGLIRITGGFLCGCLLYHIYKSALITNMTQRQGNISLFCSIAALFISIWQFNTEITICCLAVLLVLLAKNKQFLANKIMLFLGNISYCLYLCHSLVIKLAATYIKNSPFPVNYALFALFVTIFILVSSLCFAFLLHILIEKPWQKMIKQAIKKNNVFYHSKSKAALIAEQ